MSGGSMNYLYSRIEYDATFNTDTTERRAFKKHLALVAKALHDIEWVDSGDCGPGYESKSILDCLSSNSILQQSIADAELVLSELTAQIKIAKENSK